ncbi:hypothetical protein PSSM2_073.1 [Prochlorococcus phage P-SSM2]|uniref:Uncharacterized protein n=1 Tax=Prochlorococcus phage P-SSM2 TaxID=268746 RepID=Q58MT5_BPPRM|nr:hypothetical protein PSSM2_073.1 [Prochlorococcus phage P-SSM2]AAX44447.2 hypothetical protein PSSM2_073.1 [Prochlorococcus phage P-SSM2]
MNFKPITPRTRSRVDGKWIKCPHCSQTNKVYHFSWSALVCMCCRESVEKYEWGVEV